MPTLIYRLSEQGYSATLIGVFSATMWATVLVMTPLMNRLNQRFSARALLLFGMGVSVCALPLYALTNGAHIAWWFLLNVMVCLAGAAIWSLMEALIAASAPRGAEGKFMGMYQTMMGASGAIGPMLAVYAPASFPLTIALLTLFSAMLWVWMARFYIWPAYATVPTETNAAPDGSKSAYGTRHLFNHIGLTIGVAAIIGGAYEGGIGDIGILAALLYYPDKTALYVPAAIGFGSFLMQYPIGFLADRLGTPRVLAAMLTLLCASTLGFALYYDQAPTIIWPLAALWGGAGGALYTLSMTRISQGGHHPNEHTPTHTANTLEQTTWLVFLYTLGGTLAPIITGRAFDAFSAAGFGFALFAMGMMALVAMVITQWRRRTP